jgi:hypothetical protein
MRKKHVATVSELSDRPTKRLLLSREKIRMLTSEELSQAVGGSGLDECPAPSAPSTV